MPTRLNRPARVSKPRMDSFTARAGGLLFLLIGAGELFVGIRAVATGCISTMRGRHGPSVLHCAPDPWYRGMTAVALIMGVALVAIGVKWLMHARSKPEVRAAEAGDSGSLDRSQR